MTTGSDQTPHRLRRGRQQRDNGNGSTQDPQRGRGDDGDFSLAVAPPRPLIPEGTYDAKSVSAHKDRMYKRFNLRIAFHIFDGPYTDGVELAQVDGFLSLGTETKRAGPSSRIARLLQLLDPDATLDRFNGSDLVNKLWRVRVATVQSGRDGKTLHPANQYSVVRDVLDRIA